MIISWTQHFGTLLLCRDVGKKQKCKRTRCSGSNCKLIKSTVPKCQLEDCCNRQGNHTTNLGSRSDPAPQAAPRVPYFSTGSPWFSTGVSTPPCFLYYNYFQVVVILLRSFTPSMIWTILIWMLSKLCPRYSQHSNLNPTSATAEYATCQRTKL